MRQSIFQAVIISFNIEASSSAPDKQLQQIPLKSEIPICVNYLFIPFGFMNSYFL